MFFVYVLYSEAFDRIYIGITDNLDRRLSQHNNGYNPPTKSFRPWKVVFYEQYETRSEARDKEKKLKTSSGRRYIRKRIESDFGRD
ncbi:MAG: GIY-YIG nuclease family protein [Saprospiraceae bacterium]|nr:GIY-YIG nuclease family protein [Saprospiraceae bacterium]